MSTIQERLAEQELLCTCRGLYSGCDHDPELQPCGLLASCSRPVDMPRSQYLCKSCEDNRQLAW